jgi:hypothetical protein
MLKKTRLQLREETEKFIIEKITESQKFIVDQIEKRVELLLTDKDFLKRIGKELQKAEALRIAENRQRDLEELSDKEIEMEESPEPWFDFTLIGVDIEQGQAKTRMFWNTAFIKYLKDSGFTGQDEEAMVNTWFALLRADSIVEDYE